MSSLWSILWPFMPLLARVGGFLGTGPIFSSPSIPMPIRLGVMLWLTLFFGFANGFAAMPAAEAHPLAASLLMVQELLVGFALGLSANLVYLAVQQGARVAAQQMGLHDAGVLDPVTGEESESVSMIFEMTFALLFLTAGGHHLLLTMLGRSYDVLPAGGSFDPAALASMVLTAGQTMLVLAVKMAAPMLAAFLVLSVVLAALARLLPEVNILLASYPLRVGLGLMIAAGMMPLMGGFAQQIGQWMMAVTATLA